ncbi:hypothetical protein Tco_1010682, partial [Tanacetum coccineum]
MMTLLGTQVGVSELLAEVVVLEEEEVLLEEENVSYKHVFKPTEVANSQYICGNGSGIGLQHGSQLFGVPNVGPNVTTVDIGPSVSSVSVATLDVTGNNDALGLRVSQNIQVVVVSLSVLPAGVDNRDLSDKYYCIGLNISPKRQCVRGLNSVPSDNLSYVYLIKTCGGSQLRVAPVGRINRSTTISGQHDGNAQHCVHGGTSSNQQSGSRQLADRSPGSREPAILESTHSLDNAPNMVDSFCKSFYIPAEVHLTAPGRDKTIAQFLAEKDSAPHLTARQEQTVKLLESHKAPFRRYPECFLCLVGLSPYYPFDDNSYPTFERPGGTDMGLLDFIKTADPRKVRAVEVQKGDDQVTLLESTRHCFIPLVIPAAGGSRSGAATDIPAPTERWQESVAEEDAYLELADPGEGTAMVRQSDEEVVTEQPKKIKKKRLTKQSDALPAKRLRTDHPFLASGTKGKTLVGLEQIMSAGSHLLTREQSATPFVAPPQESKSFVDLSAQASLQIRTTVGSSSTLSAPVDIVAATTTSTKAKLAAGVNPDLAGPSQLEESEGSDDSFYELATLDPSEAKRWYVPRWNITNDSLLDDGFSWVARQICLGSEVRSRAEHELKLKEKLNAKYAVRGKLLEKKDSEIL